MAPPRSTAQRIHDLVYRLRTDIDLWLASASPEGVPHLIPLMFLWFEGRVFVATTETSVTVRNLSRRPRARAALGHTRDVILIDGWATLIAADRLHPDIRAAFAAETGWDAASYEGYCFIELEPEWIGVWREENEMAGRDVMRKGAWLA
jgi:hypothetical protein